ncbi:STAS domain-containing protein, partial [Parolsenella catena]
MDLSIKTTTDAGASTVTVTGEVDVSNANELREALDAVLGQTPAGISVDLAQVAYIDSTGIGVLVGAATRSADAGVTFAVTNPQP